MSLTPLLSKELRELLSEKTILIGVVLMPLVIFPLIGFTMAPVTMREGDIGARAAVLVVDQDGGKYAALFVEALRKTGLNPQPIQLQNDNLLQLIKNSEASAAVIIPQGFSTQLEQKNKPTVKLFLKLASSSVAEFERIGDIRDRIYTAVSLMGEALASEEDIAVSFYKSPINLSGEVVYRDQTLPETDAGQLFQQFFASTLLIPIALIIVVTTSGTVAATSIGLEREAKTLEMLLTYPIARSTILASKLLGSTVVALLGTASLMTGLIFYFSRVTAFAGMSISFSLSPLSLVLLAVVLFFALVTTLGLGVLAGVLAGDVRGSQQLASLIQVPLILLPLLLFLSGGIQSLQQPLATIILIIPFTHLMLATQAILESSYLNILLHIGVMVVWTVAVIGLAAFMFRGERLLTLRVRLGRRRQAV
uniref:ABC-2 type transport system permease n=1 Tax=Caldiarchaeum subterraneum TaxID=311458 RepID=E6N9Q7_CALS0|nr:ABC-2 type transport system permease [Candidatus Caldarchaeum subterraneum]